MNLIRQSFLALTIIASALAGWYVLQTVIIGMVLEAL